MDHLYNINVDIHRPTVAVGEYGEAAEEWAVIAAGVSCRIQKRSYQLVEGQFAERPAEDLQYDMYCAPEVDIAATDRVIYGDHTYEVLTANDVNYMGRYQKVMLREIV